MNNWVVESLINALKNWSDKLQEIWELVTTTPQNFKGGGIWLVIKNIHGGLQATGYALLVLFFVIGVAKSTTDFRELKRPEQALKLFIRFCIARAVIAYGMDLLLAIQDIVQGVIQKIGGSASNVFSGGITLPDVIQQSVLESSFLESIPLMIVALLSSLMVTVLSFVIILTVYSRFFSVYMYTAIAPIPMSTFAGEGTSRIGVQFLKSYAGVCLQGIIIVLACIIYSVFAASPPQVMATDVTAAQMVWNYMAELIFNMLVLVGAVKMSERLVKEMIGF